MSPSCTRLIAVVTIVFMLAQPTGATKLPVLIVEPQGSVLIRNDPEVRALLDQALDAAEQADSAEIKSTIGQAEEIITAKHGPSGRHMAVLQQEAASAFAIAGDSTAALAHGLKAVALGRTLAASYQFHRGLTLGMPVFEQTEPFRDFLSTFYGLTEDADPAQLQRLTAEAFEVAQLAQMTKAGSAVLRHQAIRAATNDRRRDEVRLVHMVADTIGHTFRTARELESGLYGGTGSPRYVEMKAWYDSQWELLGNATGLIAREKIDIADILLPQPLAADAVARLLAPDEALIFFVEGNMAELHGFVVTRETIVWREIALKLPDVEALVARFRAGIGAPLGRSAVITDEAAPDSDDVLASAWELYQALLAPFATQLQGKKHLLVTVDGALAKLPFEALLTKARPSSTAGMRNLPWLVRDHAITVLPVLSILASRDRQPPAREEGQTESFLGLGDPDYAALAGKSGLVAAAQALTKLTPLPESASEVRRIAEALGAPAQNLLIGKDASEDRLFSLSNSGALARQRMLMFATHGLLPGEIDGLYDAALALTPSEEDARKSVIPSAAGLLTSADGLLTTSEIPQLKLKADIVVLSACNTGADSSVDFEAYSGLAAAFLDAGARSVLVSHWPVKSDAAVAITTGTVKHWTSRKPGRDFAFAFRQALLDVIQTSPETARPSYWAPFSLFGEP